MASVAAFGPAGTGSGDNPQIAARAVAGSRAAPWYSQWYATPFFASLKTGTGLLVDMGQTVTVSSVITNVTIWPASTQPGTASSSDTTPLELGVKFTSDAAGYVTGVRFYKGAANTGAHVGHLWTASGTLLATATFSSETASG